MKLTRFPPDLPLGHVECCLAAAANLVASDPISDFNLSQRSLSFTNMCEAVAEYGLEIIPNFRSSGLAFIKSNKANIRVGILFRTHPITSKPVCSVIIAFTLQIIRMSERFVVNTYFFQSVCLLSTTAAAGGGDEITIVKIYKSLKYIFFLNKKLHNKL